MIDFISIAVNGFFLYIFNMLEMIKTFFIGIFVGIANIIPGVSGGTLVVVFNIYDKFVNAITLNLKKLVKNWKFVLPILSGMGCGILLFSKVLTGFIEKFPMQTNFFFVGLIIGSIPLLCKYTFKNYPQTDDNSEIEKQEMPVFIKNIILVFEILIGITIIVLFQYLHLKYGNNLTESSDVLPEFSIGLVLRLFIGGLLGAVAMIIPGISGSLIMLILNVYTVIIAAISGLLTKGTFIHSALLLLPAGLGIITGLFAGAKLISILIEKVPQYTYAVILGLIIGSVLVMLPHDLRNVNIVFCIIFMGLGFCLAFFSTLFSGKAKETKDSEIKQ